MIDPRKLKVPSKPLEKVNEKAKLTRGQLNNDNKPGYKRCYVCGELKPNDQFRINRSRNDYMQTYCKDCGKVKQAEWYYKRVHKISLEERDAMLAAQDYRCAICGNPTHFKTERGKGKNIGNEAVVDHCHDTKKIRGILCGHCNTGLGSFRDNPFSLERAIEYLLKSVED